MAKVMLLLVFIALPLSHSFMVARMVARRNLASPSPLYSSFQCPPPKAQQLLNSPGHVYLDVRTADEFNAYKVPRSFNIPCFDAGTYGLEPVVDFVDKVRETFGDPGLAPTFIVGCKIGQRSLAGMDRLRAEGYNAVNLDGGIDMWAGFGLPIEYADSSNDDLFP
mmetsp:Transcript_17165/g.35320  ORF Transcript_17165/g.35320 Transcript_17165/m.35320 type:complete len:165 (+) Transcript_17165:160-654(+)